MKSKGIADAARDLWMMRADTLGPRIAVIGAKAGRFMRSPKNPIRSGELAWYWLVGWKAGRDAIGDKRHAGMLDHLNDMLRRAGLPTYKPVQVDAINRPPPKLRPPPPKSGWRMKLVT